jgi:hypothetical protein
MPTITLALSDPPHAHHHPFLGGTGKGHGSRRDPRVVFNTAVPITKLFAWGGGGGGPVREEPGTLTQGGAGTKLTQTCRG